MANDALLYEILVNKSKLKPLNSNVAFSLTERSQDLLQCDVTQFDNAANQFFMKQCTSSDVVRNHEQEFLTFLKHELPILLSKFEKSLLGKHS